MQPLVENRVHSEKLKMTPFLQLPVSRREEREPRPELRCEGDPRGPHQGDTGAVRALLRDGLHVSGEETVKSLELCSVEPIPEEL